MAFTGFLKIVFLAPLFFLSPGYLLLTSYHRPSENGPRFSRLELLALSVVASLGAITILSLLLGLFGVFSMVYLAVCVAAIDVFLLTRRRFIPLKRLARSTTRLDILFFTFLLVACSLLYFHPFAFDFMHFREAGDNVNEGISMYREGTFFPVDDVFLSIPREYRLYFYDNFYGSEEDTYELFPSYRFRMDDGGELRFEFFYAYPALISVFYGVFGIDYVLFISSFLMLLAVILLYSLARVTLGEKSAKVSAALFSLSFLAVYFSWFHEAEVFFLLIALLLLLALTYLIKTGKKDKAFMSVLILSIPLLYLIRTEALFVFGGMVILLVLIPRKYLANLKWPIIIGGLSLIATLAFFYFLLPRYLYGILLESYSPSASTALLLTIVAVVVPALLLLITLYKPLRTWLWKNLNYILFSVFLVFVLYGFARLGKDQTYQRFNNLVFMAKYVGFIVVILMVVGMLLFLWRERGTVQKALACVTLPGLFYFLNEIHNYPLHPWCMRRYITLTFPVLILMAGYLVVQLCRPYHHSKRLYSILYALIIVLAISSLFFSYRPLISHIRNGETPTGLVDEMERFMSRFEPDDILIFHIDDWEFTMAYPLKMIYGRNTIVMPRMNVSIGGRPRTMKTEKLLEYTRGTERYLKIAGMWLDEGRSVYVINPSNEFVSSVPEDSELIIEKSQGKSFFSAFPVYTWAYKRIPKRLSTANWSYTVYEVKRIEYHVD